VLLLRRLTDVRKHQELHSDKVPGYTCTVKGCRKVFRYPKYLDRHIRRHEKQEDVNSKIEESQKELEEAVANAALESAPPDPRAWWPEPTEKDARGPLRDPRRTPSPTMEELRAMPAWWVCCDCSRRNDLLLFPDACPLDGHEQCTRCAVYRLPLT